MPLALSTAWSAPRADRADALFAQSAALGFRHMELSSLEAPVVAEIEARAAGFSTAAADGSTGPRIVSLHAPCPIPYAGAARLDDLAALDETRRLAAVDHTKRTIDAGVVVLYLGKAEGLVRQRAIVEIRRSGDPQWRVVFEEMLQRRRAQVDAHLDRTRASLQVLLAHAGGAIRLAGETRYNYYDIPNLDEFAALLAEFGPRGLGYWHDVGYAHTQATFGLGDQHAYLVRYRPWLLGFHIHDAIGANDHLPPGEGELEFSGVLAYAREGALRVLEVNAAHGPDALAWGAARIEHLESKAAAGSRARGV